VQDVLSVSTTFLIIFPGEILRLIENNSREREGTALGRKEKDVVVLGREGKALIYVYCDFHSFATIYR
jgi:hypothetical protein